MTTEELRQEMDDFKNSTQKQVDALKLAFSELQNKRPIDRYLDSDSKKILTQLIGVNFLDLLFNNIYYYNTWFDAVDGMEKSGQSFTAAGQLILETAGTGTNQAYVTKVNPVILNALDFTQPSRLRVSIQPRHTTNQNLKMVVGDHNTQAYGFEIEDATLRGFAHNATTGTTKNILTITANTNYTMEARFFPGERIDFFVDSVDYGSITTNLPTDINTAEILWSISITEQEASLKGVELGQLEYIQTREQ